MRRQIEELFERLEAIRDDLDEVLDQDCPTNGSGSHQHEEEGSALEDHPKE